MHVARLKKEHVDLLATAASLREPMQRRAGGEAEPPIGSCRR